MTADGPLTDADMIRTLIALIVLLGLAGTALAAPPAVSPPGRKAAGPPQEPAPGPVAKERQPDSWTWFGMGFESRRARLGAQDDFPAWTEDDETSLVHRATAATYAGTSRANQSSFGAGPSPSPAPTGAGFGGDSAVAPRGPGAGATSFGGGTVIPLFPAASGTGGSSFGSSIGGGSPAPAPAPAPAAPRASGSSFGGGSPTPSLAPAPTPSPGAGGAVLGSPGASVGSPGGSSIAAPAAAAGGKGR